MKIYQKPVMNCVLFETSNAIGQYIFEVTGNGCPGLVELGGVGLEGGLAFCATGDPSSPGFTAAITCQNISGTFSAVYGALESGGGLTCSGLDQSAIYPLLSLSPDLPENCIVETFTVNGSNQC